jgi:hypothetical protein
VFKKRQLRRIFGGKRKETAVGREKCMIGAS